MPNFRIAGVFFLSAMLFMSCAEVTPTIRDRDAGKKGDTGAEKEGNGSADADADADASGDGASDTDSDTDTDGDTDSDSDTDSDTDSDSDGDMDCTPDNAEQVCDGLPCVDGYCCNESCDGDCKACNVPGHEGTCTNYDEGTDPDDECDESLPSTCGDTGDCDGNGACAMYGNETGCNDNDSCTENDVCSGTGACEGSLPAACEPGPANECCTGLCDTVTGCYTESSSCNDVCGTNSITKGQSCVGCGPANAEGVCTGGNTYVCSSGNHTQCQEIECGGITRYCTRYGGTWEWRTSVFCDDEDDCTHPDACLDGNCESTEHPCDSEDCVERTCDGQGGCIEDKKPKTETCGTTDCPDDDCSGGSWLDYPDDCTRYCDGDGGCDTCDCPADDNECTVHAENVCCEIACSDISGCYTTAGSCGGTDQCTNVNIKTLASTCTGCGSAGAKGVCGGGGPAECSLSSHTECATVSCGGTTYYCTNYQGTWQWRTSLSCDDEEPCTYNDVCGGGSCDGTIIDCTSTTCMTRSCNGTSECDETPNTNDPCGTTSCPGDYCSSGSFFHYDDECNRYCSALGECDTCSCTPSSTVCQVGGGNECCTSHCSSGSGCYTSAGACADDCSDVNEFHTGRSCENCGGNNAIGSCSSGSPQTCSEGEHTLCQTTSCSGTTYYCTNVGSVWQWRTGTECDDGNSETEDDVCKPGPVCEGSSGCPPPTDACSNGSQDRDGCSKARIIGRPQAAAVYNVHGDLCFSADNNFEICPNDPVQDDPDDNKAQGDDHVYRIYMLNGETAEIFVDAGDSCDESWSSEPCLFIYTNSGCEDVTCPTLHFCTIEFDSYTYNLTADHDGWYFIVVDMDYFSDWVEGEYDLRVTLTCENPGCDC